MSDFVVIDWAIVYKSIISGARYDNVVYFLISSSTIATPCVLGFKIFPVALPKSHSTKSPLSPCRTFSTLRSRCRMGVWQWCNLDTPSQISQKIFITSCSVKPTFSLQIKNHFNFQLIKMKIILRPTIHQVRMQMWCEIIHSTHLEFIKFSR